MQLHLSGPKHLPALEKCPDRKERDAQDQQQQEWNAEPQGQGHVPALEALDCHVWNPIAPLCSGLQLTCKVYCKYSHHMNPSTHISLYR